MAVSLRERYPKMYEILEATPDVDKDLYEKATGRLVSYLRENVPALSREILGAITPVQIDLVNFIAGRLDI